jgi:hypothetical protein
MTEVDLRRENMEQARRAHDSLDRFSLSINDRGRRRWRRNAICRGRDDLARRAAEILLRDAPEKLWTRIGCVAYEDVGVACLDTVGFLSCEQREATRVEDDELRQRS